MKSNKEILKNLKYAKPAISIKDLQKRFEETEKYKEIARMYTVFGKKEDPINRKMKEFFGESTPKPQNPKTPFKLLQIESKL
jgi:hypothetical protein